MAHIGDWAGKEELGDKISDFMAASVIRFASDLLELCLEHQYPERIISGRELLHFLKDYVKMTAHMSQVLPHVITKAAIGSSEALLTLIDRGDIKTYTGEELMAHLEQEMNELQ